MLAFVKEIYRVDYGPEVEEEKKEETREY